MHTPARQLPSSKEFNVRFSPYALADPKVRASHPKNLDLSKSLDSNFLDCCSCTIFYEHLHALWHRSLKTCENSLGLAAALCFAKPVEPYLSIKVMLKVKTKPRLKHADILRAYLIFSLADDDGCEAQ